MNVSWTVPAGGCDDAGMAPVAVLLARSTNAVRCVVLVRGGEMTNTECSPQVGGETPPEDGRERCIFIREQMGTTP